MHKIVSFRKNTRIDIKNMFSNHRSKLFSNQIAAVCLMMLLSVSAFSQGAAKPAAEGFYAADRAKIDAALDKYVSDGKLSGGVLKVYRHGDEIYSHAFGKRDVEKNLPMQQDTMFRIASQTKALVSVGIMMLQEEGKLLINDPVSRYIPEFANSTVAVAKNGGGYDIVKAKRQITLRDLLTHTAGIGYGGGVAADKWKEAKITGWYFADRDEPVGDTIKRLATLPMDAQPGEKFVYGYNIDILGVVIEKASGMPLDEFLRTKILSPLKMNDTYFYVPQEKASRLAVVYSAKTDGTIERAPDKSEMVAQGGYITGPRRSFSGGAGLVSTAKDYARFLQMMLNGGSLDGARLLSKKSVDLMTVDHLNGIGYQPGQGFGLGFNVTKDLGARGVLGSVGEYGWGGAYHSTYWVDPKEGLVVVYFTQLIPARGLDDHDRIRALIYSSLR